MAVCIIASSNQVPTIIHYFMRSGCCWKNITFIWLTRISDMQEVHFVSYWLFLCLTDRLRNLWTRLRTPIHWLSNVWARLLMSPPAQVESCVSWNASQQIGKYGLSFYTSMLTHSLHCKISYHCYIKVFCKYIWFPMAKDKKELLNSDILWGTWALCGQSS